MKVISGTLVDNSKQLALTVAVGHALAKLEKDYPEIAKELTSTLIVAFEKAVTVTIFDNEKGTEWTTTEQV